MKSPIKTLPGVSLVTISDPNHTPISHDDAALEKVQRATKPSWIIEKEKADSKKDLLLGNSWLAGKTGIPTALSPTWEEFGKFEAVPHSSSSSVSSDSNSTTSSSSRRHVHFIETGNDTQDVLRTEYKCANAGMATSELKELWYTATDFRRFRTTCQADTAAGTADAVFQRNYLACYHASKAGKKVLPALTPGSDYRGLERAIFRQYLMADKVATIQAIVRAQQDVAVLYDRVESLAMIARRLTKPTSNMARQLGRADAADLRYIEI